MNEVARASESNVSMDAKMVTYMVAAAVMIIFKNGVGKEVFLVSCLVLYLDAFQISHELQGGVTTRLSPEARIRLDFVTEVAQSHIAISSRYPAIHSDVHRVPGDYQRMILRFHTDCFETVKNDIKLAKLKQVPDCIADEIVREQDQLFTIDLKYDPEKVIWHGLEDESRLAESEAAAGATLFRNVLKVNHVRIVYRDTASGVVDRFSRLQFLLEQDSKQRPFGEYYNHEGSPM